MSSLYLTLTKKNVSKGEITVLKIKFLNGFCINFDSYLA